MAALLDAEFEGSCFPAGCRLWCRPLHRPFRHNGLAELLHPMVKAPRPMYLEACLFTKYVASLLSIKKKTSKTLADFTAIGGFGLTAMCFHVNVLDTCHGTTTSTATTAGGTVFDLAPCMQVWGFCFCLYSAFRRALAPNPLNIANACYHIFLASASAASSKFSRSKSTGAADRF